MQIKPSKAESQATNWGAAADRASVAIIRLLTDIMCLIGARYVQEFRVTLVQAAA
ncbi:Uncharacterised protein [Mycobacteroides abscessus subsp. abscessus]|nr:Uncharacterised protein [Mycobacteroides abscessus subsp. abscessus]